MSHRSLFHYTLNTRHGNHSPREQVRDAVLEHLRPIIHNGAGKLAIPPPHDLSIKITVGTRSALFDIYATTVTGQPIALVTCGVASDSDGVAEFWPHLVGINQAMLKEVTRFVPSQAEAIVPPPPNEPPAHRPLLAAFLFPGMALVDESVIRVLGDLERCIAWAIIEDHGWA